MGSSESKVEAYPCNSASWVEAPPAPIAQSYQTHRQSTVSSDLDDPNKVLQIDELQKNAAIMREQTILLEGYASMRLANAPKTTAGSSRASSALSQPVSSTSSASLNRKGPAPQPPQPVYSPRMRTEAEAPRPPPPQPAPLPRIRTQVVRGQPNSSHDFFLAPTPIRKCINAEIVELEEMYELMNNKYLPSYRGDGKILNSIRSFLIAWCQDDLKRNGCQLYNNDNFKLHTSIMKDRVALITTSLTNNRPLFLGVSLNNELNLIVQRYEGIIEKREEVIRGEEEKGGEVKIGSESAAAVFLFGSHASIKDKVQMCMEEEIAELTKFKNEMCTEDDLFCQEPNCDDVYLKSVVNLIENLVVRLVRFKENTLKLNIHYLATDQHFAERVKLLNGEYDKYLCDTSSYLRLSTIFKFRKLLNEMIARRKQLVTNEREAAKNQAVAAEQAEVTQPPGGGNGPTLNSPEDVQMRLQRMRQKIKEAKLAQTSTEQQVPPSGGNDRRETDQESSRSQSCRGNREARGNHHVGNFRGRGKNWRGGPHDRRYDENANSEQSSENGDLGGNPRGTGKAYWRGSHQSRRNDKNANEGGVQGTQDSTDGVGYTSRRERGNWRGRGGGHHWQEDPQGLEEDREYNEYGRGRNRGGFRGRNRGRGGNRGRRDKSQGAEAQGVDASVDKTQQEVKYYNDECPICINGFEIEHGRYMVLDCKHRYHNSCALQWAQRQNNLTCPICSREIQKNV